MCMCIHDIPAGEMGFGANFSTMQFLADHLVLISTLIFSGVVLWGRYHGGSAFPGEQDVPIYFLPG